MTSDLPPAYDLLPTSTANIAVEDDSVPNCDDGPELIVNNSFEDKTTRIAFIQKVLAIKFLQLLLMAIVLGIFAARLWEVRSYMRHDGVHIMVLSTLAFGTTTGLLIYCTKARRENPYRYVFLIVHPITFTVFVCFPIVHWDFLDTLALAFGTYIIAVLAVLLYSVFALQTKLEFAARHACLLAGVIQILIYTVTVPVLYADAFSVLYVSLVLCINYIYMFWDLEFMTSVKYWRHITPDDFVDGALNIHLDYFNILNKIIPQICEIN